MSDLSRIEKADVADAKEILALQKDAYQSEAEIINDFSIPPLHQTLQQIQTEFEDHLFLRCILDGRIVGSVRALIRDDVCHIGKLIVHPDAQNKGLGTRLLLEIENRCSGVHAFELFTGEKSKRNLYLYQKHDYVPISNEIISEALTLIFLKKINK